MRRIYLDHAATTPVRSEVAEVMTRYLTANWGNPSSPHSTGQEARKGMDDARKYIANLINASPEEIIFTSGGTEADNFALKGVTYTRDKKQHFITTKIEHHAVLHCAEALEKEGHAVTYLDVDSDGLVDPDDVRRAIRKDTALVSVMLANNEVGTVEPVAEIARICREHGVLFHTDAVQAVGQIPVDVKKLGVDLLSMSAHKLYGPKGIGALYVRKGVKIAPILYGGAQERGRRPGTENVPGIAGFGKAAELAAAELNEHREKLTRLREKLIEEIFRRIEDVKLNGHRRRRLPGNVNVSIKYVEGESILLNLDLKGIAASSGSACMSGTLEPSHVLLAMGIPREVAHGSLRMTLGTSNTEDDIDYVVDVLEETVKKLRAMSPLASPGRC
ncbi:MAG: cysteine desulfurase NifS [Peptococcaceae bacterium]|nr:cysteine desulfurase NifS [Peptococcaceae bacterium]